MTHLDIAYRFGNYSKDLELLYDKTAGFYGALHEVMGEDANKYCPLKDWTHIEQCIRIASCLIEPAVEAGKLPLPSWWRSWSNSPALTSFGTCLPKL